MQVQAVELEEEEHFFILGLQVNITTILNGTTLEAVEEE
jgi:hypothetical protein